DSDSDQITGGVKFDPVALIKGSAQVGYRRFKPLAGDVPGFTGTTAIVDLSYVAFATTRFSVQGVRDVQYSFDVAEPYYLLSGMSGSIEQQLFGPVDVEARVGAQRLHYQNRQGAAVLVSDRTDRVRSYGGGVGYHVGQDLRIGLNVDQQRRLSDLALRKY